MRCTSRRPYETVAPIKWPPPTDTPRPAARSARPFLPTHRRLADCFASVSYFERQVTPFIVAVKCVDGAKTYDPRDVRIALDLDPRVPFVRCDARNRESAKEVLITLVEHALMASGAITARGLESAGVSAFG